jgi:hypothetical protein
VTVRKLGTDPGLSTEGGRLQIVFAELSPSTLKYCIWRQGLIDSLEVRLPIAIFSRRIDEFMRTRQEPLKDLKSLAERDTAYFAPKRLVVKDGPP